MVNSSNAGSVSISFDAPLGHPRRSLLDTIEGNPPSIYRLVVEPRR